MSPLKQIDRTATVAFCPVPAGKQFLAGGTAGGSFDGSFNTSSCLELFSLDFASGDPAPAIAGSVPVPERFNRLAWGAAPSDASRMPLGIIAGGLTDGTICLWDPAAVLSGGGKAQPLAKMQKHAGAVKGLEFNASSPNLLASGGSDGELCIWDAANPAQPSLYPGLKSGAAPGAAPVEITYLSWNRKVQHILASTQVDGATVIWDLKKQRPVITLKDPNSQRRCSVLQWNPEVATQLVVASDDDRAPTLQLWDLRNSMGPVKEFVGHTKGVLGMAWCQQDPGLLLSCSKDNRTICWEVGTTDVLCELPASGNWDFDVQWSPALPGVFATSSFDGKLAVHSVLACTGGGVVQQINADFSTTSMPSGKSKPLKRAPNWMRRPCGVAFGFGGRLASFSHSKQQVTDPATGQVRAVDAASVTVTQVVTEASLVQHSEAFESSISGGDRGALRDYCAHKAAAAQSGDESETWTFMGVLFEDDARRQLLQRLGFADALAAA